MPITDYASLKTAVGNWMARSDMVGEAADFISLAEAGLNRELDPVEIDVTLTGVVNSRSIDVSAQAMVEPIALFLAETGRDEVQITPKADGTFPYLHSSGRPSVWAIDGDNIDFDRPLDQAYPFRFRFRQRFALSDTVTTNWLLTKHPDLYLAATIIWGGFFIQDDNAAARWATILNTALPSVRNSIAQSKRALASVDAGLLVTRNRGLPYSMRNDV